MKEEYTDKRTGITYTKNEDYYFPNLILEPEEKIVLNKYARMILKFVS